MKELEGPVAILGDAHLREGEGEVGAFVEFVDGPARDVRALVILGDLFAAWVGRIELQRPHHNQVLEALRRLRKRGCRLVYVEGNHDFFLAPLYGGDPFEVLAKDNLDVAIDGRTVHLSHGDLVNRRDRRYRAWRAVSKSRLPFALFNLIPAKRRLHLIDRLERKLAGTNVAFRGGLPRGECEAHLRARLRQGAEIVVLGHFHEEQRIDCREGGLDGTLFVLPAWRRGHRYLRFEPGAEPAFVSA